MKTIEFEGKKYDVEDWVKYIARDHDGQIFAYERKPGFTGISEIWVLNQSKSDKNRYYCIYTPEIHWQDSLTEV